MRSKRQYTLIAAKPHLLPHLQASLCWSCLDFFLVDVGLALELLARSGVIGLGPEFRGVHMRKLPRVLCAMDYVARVAMAVTAGKKKKDE